MTPKMRLPPKRKMTLKRNMPPLRPKNKFQTPAPKKEKKCPTPLQNEDGYKKEDNLKLYILWTGYGSEKNILWFIGLDKIERCLRIV